MDIDEARVRIAEIRRSGGKVSPDELDELWAALPVVRPEEILGSWRGGEFDSGHRFEGTLEKIGWHGKRFDSLTSVAPLVCRAGDGSLYVNSEMAGGGASLWMVEFRGEVTATMVYDGKPVLDHFKRVDEETLLGVMNGKGVRDSGRFYYFILNRELSTHEVLTQVDLTRLESTQDKSTQDKSTQHQSTPHQSTQHQSTQHQPTPHQSTRRDGAV
ncbi:DUF4334 domain-containing protein [Actinoplanes sp. NPDC051861]|uniref:DUF4334 domain-containing protein n=1 Tax=Actinoplanes sp. NPDC051861 TaxID=3155170 RepID=UPI0034386CFE